MTNLMSGGGGTGTPGPELIKGFRTRTVPDAGAGSGSGIDGCAATRVAEYLRARRTGPERWVAKCPAHPDRSPSLSIAKGRDGRALLRCFAGCDVARILEAAGLNFHHLFSGPRRNAEPHATQAARDRLRADQQAQREAHRAAEDWLRQRWHTLNDTLRMLARQLMRTPDNAPGVLVLNNYFHSLLAELRFIERALSGEPEWH